MEMSNKSYMYSQKLIYGTKINSIVHMTGENRGHESFLVI